MATACLLTTGSIMAHDFVVNGIYYNITDETNKTVEVTYENPSGNTYKNTVIIPENVTYNDTTYSVTMIGEYAFYYCTELTSITIPNNVTNIGDFAFYNCKGLTNVVIPNSVTNIGINAFSYCSGLTGVTIPNGVTSIRNNTFASCSGLTSVTIPNNVTSIGDFAFSYCRALTRVVIPSSVTSIGDGAFNSCTGLASINIPNSITSIGNYAFDNTAWYKNQPDGVVYAGKVLYNYKGTIPDSTSLDIKEGTVSISNGAFRGCSGLISIKIPGSITTIGNEAFNGCTSLTELYINDGKKTLSLGYGNTENNPEALFYNCPLETIYLGRDLSYKKYSNGYSPFYKISTLKTVTISDFVTSIGDYAFYNCTNLANINIPKSVISIGDYAFYDCTTLVDINIPDSVKGIGISAFYGTEWLKNKNFPNGLVYIGKVLYKYTGEMPSNTSINIEEGTVGIAGGAFWGRRGLTSITIPNSVTSIGGYAFCECSGLTSIEIPNSVTSIGDYAFSNCSGLTSIEIPNSITSIGEHAFNSCTGLTSIEIPNSITTIGDYVFNSCTGLTSIEIPNSVTSIGNSAFNGCTGLTSIEIPNSITSIGSQSFYNCTGLESIEIPCGVTSIGAAAFGACNNIRDITIPENVTSLGTGTFGYCPSLESIVLPNSITIIPQKIFYACDKLKNVKIGKRVTEIGNSAFSACKNLQMIIPKSVRRIGRDAFSGCSQASLVILHRVQSMETPTIAKTAKIYVPTTELIDYYTNYSDSVKYILTEEFAATATTFSLKISNNIPEILEFSDISIDNYENITDSLVLTGLDPDTEYSFTYYVTTEEAGRIEKQVTVRTEPLKFNTLKAKATSNTKAIICAEANIANEEAGTGFEWRRIDAPDLVPSELVGCAIHEGVMEGALHNLSANTYYKYRPYYCSATGNYYYGEWIGFGTADAYVYFTPTIHTYTSTKKDVNSVRLNGYVLAGSDNIKEQGFEYWPVGKVQAAPSRSGDSRNVTKVTASGQRMSAVIEDLEYGTVYACRAYVITESEIFYGEEITFETSYPTGIADVYEKEDEASIRVMGNTIVVSGHKPGDKVLVYTMHGAVIYNGTADEEITLESGMYIVNIGNTTKKVRIR